MFSIINCETKVLNSIKNVIGRPICNICLKEGPIQKLDKLDVCSTCLEKIRALESEQPIDVSKEQKAGGIKDEL